MLCPFLVVEDPHLAGGEYPVLHQFAHQTAPNLRRGSNLLLPVCREEHDELPGDGEMALQQRSADPRLPCLLNLKKIWF